MKRAPSPAMRSSYAILLPLILFSVLYSGSDAHGGGELVAWGDNQYGQCEVPQEARSGVTMIAAGGDHTLALKDGKVIAWGRNVDLHLKPCGQIDVPAEAQSGVSQIAAGALHSLALKDGRVIAWGQNIYGQCDTPQDALSGVTHISAGDYFSIAVKDGKLIVFGGRAFNVDHPPVETQSGIAYTDGGLYHGLALKGGRVIAWGEDRMFNYGQRDVPPTALSGVAQLSAGVYHSLALKNGQAIAWGRNDYGQCDTPPDALSGVTVIGAGWRHNLAVKGGGVLAWGNNDRGQCNVPAEAQGGVTQVSGEANHSLALIDGKPICLTPARTTFSTTDTISITADVRPLTVPCHPFLRVVVPPPAGQGGVTQTFYWVENTGWSETPTPIFVLHDPITTASPILGLQGQIRVRWPRVYHLEAGAVDATRTTSVDDLIYLGPVDRVTLTVY